MTDTANLSPAVEVLDATTTYTIEELCVACQVDGTWIADLVEHGVIEPKGRPQANWTFDSLTVVRVAKARRLERDLSLNPPGIALVLDLLDEIDDLRARLKAAGGGTNTPA